MKKQILLALMAATSLGSLQAANPSLTNTTSFVLTSVMQSIGTTTETVESFSNKLMAITAIAFATNCYLEYLNHKYLEAQIQQERERKIQQERERKRQQEQRQELEQLKQLEEQLITYNERSNDLKSQIQKREQSIKKINVLLTNDNMTESERAFILTSLETAQSDLQYWHNELAKLTARQLNQ